MSSRHSIAGANRTAKFLRPSLVQGRKALVAVLTETAAVVSLTAERTSTLPLLGIDVITHAIVQRGQITLHTGDTVSFVRADGLPAGYYYLTSGSDGDTVPGAPEGIGCTCVAGLSGQPCLHHEAIAAKGSALAA